MICISSEEEDEVVEGWEEEVAEVVDVQAEGDEDEEEEACNTKASYMDSRHQKKVCLDEHDDHATLPAAATKRKRAGYGVAKKPASKKAKEEEEKGPIGWRTGDYIYAIRTEGCSYLSYKKKFLVEVQHSIPQWEEIFQALRHLAQKKSFKPFPLLKELLLAERAMLYDAYKEAPKE